MRAIDPNNLFFAPSFKFTNRTRTRYFKGFYQSMYSQFIYFERSYFPIMRVPSYTRILTGFFFQRNLVNNNHLPSLDAYIRAYVMYKIPLRVIRV